MSACFKFLNIWTAEALCLHSVMLRLPSAYFSHYFYMHPSFRQWGAPLTFPRAWLCRRPRKAEETHQRSVHFFAFLPSLPPPGRHRPLPVMHQVRRWVKLMEEKHKQSLIRSTPKYSVKKASRRLLWFPSISGKLLCVQLFHARDSKD